MAGKISISITDEHAAIVQEAVRTGVYRIAEDGVEIVRIVHGRRDLYEAFEWLTRCTRSMLAALLDFCLCFVLARV